ncbi:hypothetical protein DOTSEDRAFT_36968 [Dothistroma septosporum NZE10]|uniref:Uncharacterized protein n=1 Tax=Dothistroma septosporum (strain NZE10 / CBS 128990) TaxID=675120 RepID=N1PG55_DOTSN|nr:hypothetical protein DOTSEDRAFT_36968 [Dothistroma septosporum NZE10]
MAIINGSLQPETVTDFATCLKDDVECETADLPVFASARPRVIGKVGIFRALPSNEIGFVLDRTCWCRGPAKEALTTILAHLFSLKQEYEADVALREAVPALRVNLSSWSYEASGCILRSQQKLSRGIGPGSAS